MLFFQLFPKLTGIDQWLSDPAKTPWLIVLVAIWQGAGYYMIVYLAGLQNIPTDVVEAAKIDGAGSWQRFRNITLPLILPAVTISLFLTIANALKNFDMIYAMTSGSAYTFGTVPVVLDIFFDAFARKQAGLATAKAMLLFALIFIITSIQLYVMKKREVEQ
jgi:raffinose/stachyose/melibiose transport system permease protein